MHNKESTHNHLAETTVSLHFTYKHIIIQEFSSAVYTTRVSITRERHRPDITPDVLL